MNTLTEWQAEVVDWANRKGWWDVPSRNDGELIALMHSEVSEAYDGLTVGLKTMEENEEEEDIFCVMSEKDETLPNFVEEMADVVIRLFDWTGHRGIKIPFESQPVFELIGADEEDIFGMASNLLNQINYHLSQILEELRQKERDAESIQFHCNDVVVLCRIGCEMVEWTLENAIEAKMAINEKRPRRHGDLRM